MSDFAFRTCGSCMRIWLDWREFVLDPGLRLLGLQVVPQMPDANLLVFEHECGSSVSVLATRLRPFLGHDGAPLPTLFGTELCRNHCSLLEDLKACDQACANARDREMTVLIEEIKRTGELPRSEVRKAGA